MTTSTTTAATINSARIAAMTALASRCRINIDHGFTLPGDVFDAYLSAISAATYPTLANIERKLESFDRVSARVGISVDFLVDWSEVWAEALVDHDHLAVSGLTVVDGELVRS